MSRLLLRPTPLHRMASRPTPGGGIRWSSYVGDLRCMENLSKSYFSTATASYHFVGGVGREASPNAGGDRRLSSSTMNNHNLPRSAPHERLLVLGSGVAGCAAALTAARHGVPVTVLHAGSAREDCNSYWAQGGVIYRNYRLREEDKTGEGGESKLVDTPLSLVNDIRVASGYQSPLQRTQSLEEGAYSSDLIQNNHNLGAKMGRRCPTSGVHWNEDAAWKLACEGPARIRELLLGTKDDGLGDALGCVVPFDRTKLPTGSEDDDNDSLGERDGTEDDVLSLCLEASHAAPRIIHHADCTGKAITVGITKAASEHPLIEFVGDRVATDLIFDEEGHGGQISGANERGMVIGAKVLDKRTNRPTDMYAVHGVVLASGGLAGIYRHSTNPLGFNALGSSVGLALRLEDRLSSSGPHHGGIASDLEYVQFHPTALCLPGEARFLLTEALRGEGAILRDASGRAFARDYHPNGELAPRDIVARAVFSESQKASTDGTHNAYLDISHRDSRWLVDRFPSIHAHLSSRDTPMDFTKEKIPVIPAAHYTCGGVTTDLHGRVVSANGASYGNLYAAGEAARTGLHGGNRLASTSLLEGLVFGASVGEVVAGVAGGDDDELAMEGRERATEAMHRARHAIEHRLVMEQRGSSSSASNGLNGHGGLNGNSADARVAREAEALLAHLKALMWDNVGVVRTPSKLAEAASELTALRDEADCLWQRDGAGWEAAALRDAAHAGRAVAEAALANRTSGGAHCVVLEENDEEGDGLSKAQHDSDDEDDGLVVARA